MQKLDVSGNSFTGPLPSSLGGLEKLEVLRANGNQLSGSLPPELAQLHSLTEISLDGNGFEVRTREAWLSAAEVFSGLGTCGAAHQLGKAFPRAPC